MLNMINLRENMRSKSGINKYRFAPEKGVKRYLTLHR